VEGGGVKMLKLKTRGLKWLKGFHLIAVSCWVGGAVALILLYFLKDGVADGGVLYGINQSLHHVDTFVVVIPGAIGCLITGLIYSSFSNWGFFKHTWLTLKWIVTVIAILFGTFFLGPWEKTMMITSGKLGMSSLTDQTYLYNEKMNIIFGSVQCLLLIITIFISIFKPWKNKKDKVG
jgi:glucose uptake protein GlcU